MKKLFAFLLLILPFLLSSQHLKFKLTNALIIGQFDRPEDRYAIEVNTNEILTKLGIKTQPSLNFLKQGADINVLTNDSLQQNLKSKGFDTYLVVNVKGYDRKFKASTTKISLTEILNRASIYPIYRDEVTSISFEFLFFKNNEMICSYLIKLSNISNRDSSLKKFKKVLESKIKKKWLD